MTMLHDRARIKRVDLHGCNVQKAKNVVRKTLSNFDYNKYDQVIFIVGKGNTAKMASQC